MNTQEAIKKISTEKLQPLYLVLGTEKYFQQQLRTAFNQRRQSDDLEELNFMSFDLNEHSLDQVLDEAETLPFFGDYRMIFVENPLFLTGTKTQDSEASINGLTDYLKNPIDSTILVFWADFEKLDGRKKISKTLKKAAEEIDTTPLGEGPLRNYLKKYLTQKKIQLSQDAFELLLRLTDLNLTKAINEIDKLALSVAEGSTISQEQVAALVTRTLEESVFEMTESLLKGNAEKTLAIYHDLHLQGEETIRLSSIFIGQVRLLLQTKILQKLGYQQANIAETLGIHPYRVKLAMQQTSKFPVRLLTEMFDELVENDYLTKTGRIDKELNFQLFIIKTTEKIKAQ